MYLGPHLIAPDRLLFLAQAGARAEGEAHTWGHQSSGVRGNRATTAPTRIWLGMVILATSVDWIWDRQIPGLITVNMNHSLAIELKQLLPQVPAE